MNIEEIPEDDERVLFWLETFRLYTAKKESDFDRWKNSYQTMANSTDYTPRERTTFQIKSIAAGICAKEYRTKQLLLGETND